MKQAVPAASQASGVPGAFGIICRTTPTSAFAAGNRAKANHTGSFVWADSQNADFASTAVNQFNVRAGGGVRLETGGAGLTLDGNPLVSGPVTTADLSPSVADGLW